jgi:hypothetical protein
MDRLRRIMCGTALVSLMLASSGCPWWERWDRRGHDRDDNRSDRDDRDRDRDDHDRDQDRDRDRDDGRDRRDPERDR